MVIKTVSYFVDVTSNLGLVEKDWRDGSSSAWDWGKEGLAWGIRGREKLYTWTTKQTTSKTVVKDFPCTSRVPSSDCFKSIALHKKCIFLKNYLFFGSLLSVMRQHIF